MDRESYYETLFHKLDGRRGSELRLLTELARELSELSRRMQALRVYFEDTDRIVADCAETLDGPWDEAE